MTNKEKIDTLEYFTRGHYSSEQYYAYGLCNYFVLLRKPEADLEFLDELEDASDLSDYARDVVRYMFAERIHD